MKKDILRELFKQKIRALYIFVMIFLAVATFVGLNVTYKNISRTINEYKEKNDLYDLKILGNIDENTLQKIKKDPNITIESGFLDYFNIDDNATVLNVSSINKLISKPILTKGRFPELENEVILNQLSSNYDVGDIIDVYKKNHLEMQSIKHQKLKVVGIYENPEYISRSLKEIVNVGESTVKTFILAKKELFNFQKPNLFRVRFNDLEVKNITDKNYVKKLNKRIENFKKEYSLDSNNIHQSITDNSSIMSFKDSIKTLNSIKLIFPIIFFMIVILVCTTSLTRLILDQTRMIGTYLFLGYKKYVIYIRYLLIALIPTIIATPLGVLCGIYYLPRLMYKAFSSDYVDSLQTLTISINGIYTTVVVFASLICVIISVLLSLNKVLKKNIVGLLQKNIEERGSSILLEKVNFFWKRLSFKNKITTRNLFRYKIKMLLCILGISGCTSLMFLGFGIKEAYLNISNKSIQIRDVDYSIIYKDSPKNILASLYNGYIVDDLYTENIVLEDKNLSDQNVVVTIFNKLPKNITFLKNDKKINIEKNGVYLTKRLYEKLNLDKGEYINLKINGELKTYEVLDYLDNYISNYIYLFDENKVYDNNTLLININGSSPLNTDKIYKNKNVVAVFNEKILLSPIENVSNSLNMIVLIISLLSITLSFVVSLNLMSINISERKKEISTLKVLGFSELETTWYIFKELLIVNILSLGFGYLGGHLLIQNIFSVLKETNVVFITKYTYKPFLYTFLILFVFTIIVFRLIYKIIGKINMVEALKIDE